MRVAYLADNLFDAHLVKHALEDAGLPAFVFGESLLGGMGELPLFGVLRVCVPDTAFPEARDVVQALGLESPADGPILEGDGEGLGILPA
ncbi:DUF2007 domain-containing protein [Pseudoxanthomonas putridarboris]|uniref:DUF2007 domain-containing protein n=1 Tax=Pseudoxanthomonas putridarboris TaxID=752605 RepID=A0ABU9J2Z0_9GAMM